MSKLSPPTKVYLPVSKYSIKPNEVPYTLIGPALPSQLQLLSLEQGLNPIATVHPCKAKRLLSSPIGRGGESDSTGTR